MTSGDRRLQRVGSKRASERLRTFERGEPATDEEWVPLPAALIEEEDRLAGRSLAHRPEASLEIAGRRYFERDVRSGKGPFRADDPLRDGRLGYEEGARDLVRGEASE